MKKKRRKKLADKKLQNTKLYELANTIYNNKETKTLPKQHKNSPELIKKKKKKNAFSVLQIQKRKKN